MHFMELVKSRRSIRSYDGRPVRREDLELCIEAARYAPSACNSQPWKFIAVDDAAKKEIIAKSIFSGLYSMNSFARDASAFIVIILEKSKPFAWLGEKFQNTDFRRIDIGIACEHIIMQARDLGLDTCILGWFNEKMLKKILSVPYTKKAELVLALGYSTGQEIPEKRLKEKKETFCFNKYQ